MNPDKMLSEAEIDMMERACISPYNDQRPSILGMKKLCAQAKLAIPKPRQDAGRVEDALRKALLCAEAYTNYDNSESLKDRLKREVFTAHGWNGTEPLWAFVTKLRHHALTLEAKPQPQDPWEVNAKEAWTALAMIREAIETLGPMGAVKSGEEVLPGHINEANAIIEGIQKLSDLWRAKPQPDEGALQLQKEAVEFHNAYYKEYPDSSLKYAQLSAIKLKAFKAWIEYFDALAQADAKREGEQK